MPRMYLSYDDVRNNLSKAFFSEFRTPLVKQYCSKFEGMFSGGQLDVIRGYIESAIRIVCYMGLNNGLNMSGFDQLKLINDLRQLLQPVAERSHLLIGEERARLYLRLYLRLQSAMDVNIDVDLDDPEVNLIMQLAESGPNIDMTDVKNNPEKLRMFLGYVKDMTRQLLDRYTSDALRFFEKYRPDVYAAFQQNQQLELEHKQSTKHVQAVEEEQFGSKVRFFVPDDSREVPCVEAKHVT